MRIRFKMLLGVPFPLPEICLCMCGMFVMLQACLNTCADRTIVSQCGCFRQEHVDYYPSSLLQKLDPCSSEKGKHQNYSLLLGPTIINLKRITPYAACACQSSFQGDTMCVVHTEKACAFRVRHLDEVGKLDCGCRQACMWVHIITSYFTSHHYPIYHETMNKMLF